MINGSRRLHQLGLDWRSVSSLFSLKVQSIAPDVCDVKIKIRWFDLHGRRRRSRWCQRRDQNLVRGSLNKLDGGDNMRYSQSQGKDWYELPKWDEGQSMLMREKTIGENRKNHPKWINQVIIYNDYWYNVLHKEVSNTNDIFLHPS